MRLQNKDYANNSGSCQLKLSYERHESISVYKRIAHEFLALALDGSEKAAGRFTPGHGTAMSIQLEAGLDLWCSGLYGSSHIPSSADHPVAKSQQYQLELIKRTFLLHCLLILLVLCCWSHTGPKWVTICNRKYKSILVIGWCIVSRIWGWDVVQ